MAEWKDHFELFKLIEVLDFNLVCYIKDVFIEEILNELTELPFDCNSFYYLYDDKRNRMYFTGLRRNTNLGKEIFDYKTIVYGAGLKSRYPFVLKRQVIEKCEVY